MTKHEHTTASQPTGEGRDPNRSTAAEPGPFDVTGRGPRPGRGSTETTAGGPRPSHAPSDATGATGAAVPSSPGRAGWRRWFAVTGPDVGLVTAAERFWFPGRWIAGVSLIAGPLFMLAGTLLRSPFHFFYPEQLAAYRDHPGLITAAYTSFALGNLLLWPGIAALCRGIGASRPSWALWAGTLVTLGLFTRAYHSGTDQLVFALADTQGTAAAGRLVGDYYHVWGELTWHPYRTLAGAIFFGWIVLAIAGWRSRVFGPVGALAVAAMTALPLGTIKGTELPMSVIATGGLTLALAPLGWRLLAAGPRPSRRALLWTAFVVTGLVIGALFGPKG